VTIDGDLLIDGEVFVRDGLTVNGDIHLRGRDGELRFEEYSTLDNTTVHMDTDVSYNELFGLHSFTLGDNLVVRGRRGRVSSDRIENHGEIRGDVAEGRMEIIGDFVNNHGMIEARNGGRIQLGDSSTHWINHPGGTIRGAGGDLTLAGQGFNQGTVSTDDTNLDAVEDFFNEGSLRIGPGSHWTLREDFAQAPWAELLLVLEGSSPGSGFGILDVGGDAQLAGLLEVDLLGGYLPAYGDRFEFLLADRIIRRFDALDLPGLPEPLYFDVLYGYTSVTLEVVPEPAMLPVVLVGGLLVCRRRRGESGLRKVMRA
jgi:hypothetical protein